MKGLYSRPRGGSLSSYLPALSMCSCVCPCPWPWPCLWLAAKLSEIPPQQKRSHPSNSRCQKHAKEFAPSSCTHILGLSRTTKAKTTASCFAMQGEVRTHDHRARGRGCVRRAHASETSLGGLKAATLQRKNNPGSSFLPPFFKKVLLHKKQVQEHIRLRSGKQTASSSVSRSSLLVGFLCRFVGSICSLSRYKKSLCALGGQR